MSQAARLKRPDDLPAVVQPHGGGVVTTDGEHTRDFEERELPVNKQERASAN
jgi:hypothetical protein